MPVVRTYRCKTCDHTWDVFHASSDDPIPDCPHCDGRAAWQPGGFAIKGNAGRAGDMAQQMLVDDFGLSPSQINDSQREGDIAYKAPPETREIRDAKAQVVDINREIMNEAEKAGQKVNLPTHPAWGGKVAAVTPQRAQLIAGAKMAADQANREGVNPMLMLQKAAKAGAAPTKARVMTDRGERPYTIGKNLFGG